MPNNSYSQGFTLIELLLSLFLTAMMVMGITQYLLVSSRVSFTLQQEVLAAKTLESLLIQASFSNLGKSNIEAVLASNACPSNLAELQLDFTFWCQALDQLPQLKINSNASYLTLEWQAPNGKKIIRRPPFN